MKIVVMGGSGLIGKKLVALLRSRGHEVVAASPSSGVNALTGEGLAEALCGAEVVVDVEMIILFPEGLTEARNQAPAEQALRPAAFAHLFRKFADVLGPGILGEGEELQACDMHGLLALFHEEEKLVDRSEWRHGRILAADCGTGCRRLLP